MTCRLDHLVSALPNYPLKNTLFSIDSIRAIGNTIIKATESAISGVTPPVDSRAMAATMIKGRRKASRHPDVRGSARYKEAVHALYSNMPFRNGQNWDGFREGRKNRQASTTARLIVGTDDPWADYRRQMQSTLKNVLEFFYVNGPIDFYELFLEYNRQMLNEIFHDIHPPYSMGTLATYEATTHLNRYVMLSNLEKPFSEHLVHQCFVCYTGLQLLCRYHPMASGQYEDVSLAALLAERLKDCFPRDPRKRDKYKEHWGILKADWKEIEEIFADKKRGTEFVLKTWLLISLLHDSGYYIATLWDLFNYNLVGRFDSPHSDNKMFCSMGRFEILDNLNEETEQVVKFVPRLGEHLNPSHFRRTILALTDVRDKMWQGDLKNYISDLRQCHPFWGVVELDKRYALKKDAMTLEQRLSFMFAMCAIYSHHFEGPNAGGRELSGRRTRRGGTVGPSQRSGIYLDEASSNFSFATAPFAFLLYLVDSMQNFGRFKFSSRVNTRASKGGKENPEIRIPLEMNDFQVILSQGAEKMESGVIIRPLLIRLTGREHRSDRIRSLQDRVVYSNRKEAAYRDRFIVTIEEILHDDDIGDAECTWPDGTKIRNIRRYIKLPNHFAVK